MGYISHLIGIEPMVNYISITCVNPTITRGLSLDEVIEELETNMPQVTVCLPDSKLVALVMENETILHPAFAEEDIPDMKFLNNPSIFNRDRMSMEHISEYEPLVDVCIIDSASELMVTRLVHVAEEFNSESWEVCDLLCFYYPILPELISLMKRIRNARLEDFYSETLP